MSVQIAERILMVLGAYFAVGGIFALMFVIAGAKRIDPAAGSLPVTVRALIFPGAAILWPLLLFKWVAKQQPPVS